MSLNNTLANCEKLLSVISLDLEVIYNLKVEEHEAYILTSSTEVRRVTSYCVSKGDYTIHLCIVDISPVSGPMYSRYCLEFLCEFGDNDTYRLYPCEYEDWAEVYNEASSDLFDKFKTAVFDAI